MLRTIQENQPIALTGIFQHMYLWVTSSTEDVVYKNPKFDAKKAGDNAVAIYCNHGTADRSNSFKLVAERLLINLPDYVESITLVTYDHRYQGVGIENLSEQFKEKVKSRENKSVKKAVLLGHSRGCFLNELFALYLAKEIDIDVIGIFSIVGPYGGSPYAQGFLSYFSESIKQMMPGSDFLNTLRVKVAQSDIPHYYFAGGKDSLVSVTSAYIPEHLHRLVILEKHGHLSIMSSHVLVNYIRQGISELVNQKLELEAGETSLEENLLEFDNELIDVLDSYSSITNVCNEINAYISELKLKWHIWSSANKIALLEKLKEMLMKMSEGERGDDYPKAETIGDFIIEFSQDASSNNGVKPVEALNEPLNYPVNFLSGSNSQSQNFILMLAVKYNGIYLPRRKFNLDANFSCTI